VRRDDEASPAVVADAEVVGGEGFGIVARRPMDVHETQIPRRKGTRAGEPHHPVANTSLVNPPPQSPGDDRPVEGEYLAPSKSPASGRNWRAKGGWLVGAGVLAAKFKGLLLVLLNFKYALYASKFALSAVSFIASIWFYTLFFGFKFAIVFVLLIAIHELGHVIFVRGFGLAAPFVFFLPGFGAFTTWRDPPKSVYQESVIAFGGPLLGTLGGLVCYAYGYVTHEPFWYACANTAFFLNLFNMIPLSFFDGGRMTGAISPAFWLLGFAIVVGGAVAFHWWSPILLLLILLSIPRVVQAYRGRLDPRYYGIPGTQRLGISLAYFGLLAVLLACLIFTRVSIPGHTSLA
jgi:Zn-dependent protease